MDHIPTFESFTSQEAQIDESIRFGSYTFTSRLAFQGFEDAIPSKGESCFCVFQHNLVEINGEEQYLGSNGSGLRYQIIGLFADEADAKEAYSNAVSSKKSGQYLSVSMGTLTAKTKFQFNYDETDGTRAKGTVK